MSDTPRTDRMIADLRTPAGGLCEGAEGALIGLARKLEREMADSEAARHRAYMNGYERGKADRTVEGEGFGK